MVAYEEQPPVLRCYGDEDMATQGIRRRAFARAVKAPGDLVVDLSELVFADSSLILDLAVLAQRARSQGRCVWVRDAQPQITRLIELVGLDRQPGVEMS